MPALVAATVTFWFGDIKGILTWYSSASSIWFSSKSFKSEVDAIIWDDNKFELIVLLLLVFTLMPRVELDDRLYVDDELPILTRVGSLLLRWLNSDIGLYFVEVIRHVTNIASKARMAPKRNGGPGSKCFKFWGLSKFSSHFQNNNYSKSVYLARVWRRPWIVGVKNIVYVLFRLLYFIQIYIKNPKDKSV